MGKRWRWWVTIAVSIAALSGATLALAAWVHLPARLSESTAVCDVEPRADLSDDGNWIASVWIQGRKVNNGCVSRGPAVVSWATTATSQGGWSRRIALPLPTGYSSGCFVHADVALDDNTAHIASTIWYPCDQMNADSLIVHHTCDLLAGNCSQPTIVASQLGSEDLRFSESKIELDSQHRPHIVYGRGTHSLALGKLFYTRYIGAEWSAPLQLSPGSETAYRPSMAYSNARIHVVWETHRDYLDNQGRWRQNGDLRYRYCEEAGACGTYVGYPSPTQLVETTYPFPDITAQDGRVILTWNVCADVDANPPCEKFYLVYARSNTNGTSFPIEPLEVGTDMLMRFISFSTRHYPGSDGDDNQAGEYASHLNPTIALDPAGLPYLAWQVKQDGGYIITTTRAISETYSNFTWSPEGLPDFGAGSDNRVYPSLELTTVDDTQALHLVYMQTWREGIWGRSQIYYDVFSPARPTLSLNYLERTSVLPHERAQTITARVAREDGTGEVGVPVVFTATLGSFSYDGYGVSQIQTTTDAQGDATVTLYSNLTGTAHVGAWIDSVNDLNWDVEEPRDMLTQTWVYSGTPALVTVPGPVRPGNWITATITDHPYSDLADPEGGGAPLSYVLWWCPVDAPDEPISQQIGESFLVDIDTWTYAPIIEVPGGVTGTYRLETHLDPLGNPCEDPGSRVAATDELSATLVYPPDPLITIGDGRPYPGGVMTATLRQHAADTYSVWWCTDSGNSIAQVVADNTQVDSDAVDIDLVVPIAAVGLYHLESHSDAPESTCGNPNTYVAESSLIWPSFRVFLPLVMRSN